MTEEAMELYNFSDVNLKGAKMFIALQRESFYTISEEMQKVS